MEGFWIPRFNGYTVYPAMEPENRKKNPTLQLNFVGLGSNPLPPRLIYCTQSVLLHTEKKIKKGQKGGHIPAVIAEGGDGFGHTLLSSFVSTSA